MHTRRPHALLPYTLLPRTRTGRLAALCYLLLVTVALATGLVATAHGRSELAATAMPVACLLTAPLSLLLPITSASALLGLTGSLAPTGGTLVVTGAVVVAGALLDVVAVTALTRRGLTVRSALVPRTCLGRAIATLYLLTAVAGIALVGYDAATYDGSGGASFAGVPGLLVTMPASLLTSSATGPLTAALPGRPGSVTVYALAVGGAALLQVGLATAASRLVRP